MAGKRLSEEEQQLFDALRRDKLEDIKVFRKRDYRGYAYSAIFKYPEAAHFAYELLQNADDALATSAHFILFPDKLIFKHNGKRQFNITEQYADENEQRGDINTILSYGDSNKDKYNKVGKFGVGFKSVFQYTDSPEIYDDKFSFRIIDLYVPELIKGDHPLRQDGETLFVFPFSNQEEGYSDIKNRLDALKSPLLFMPHLKEVTWEIDEEGAVCHRYSKEVKSLWSRVNEKCEKVTENKDDEERQMFLFTRTVILPDSEQHCDICVGFILSDDGNHVYTQDTQKVFCYFETSTSFQQKFICHAPFELIESRTELRDTPANRFFKQSLAILAADALSWIRDLAETDGKPYIDSNLFDIVDYKFYKRLSDVSFLWQQDKRQRLLQSTEGVFYATMNDALKGRRILPTKEHKYIAARDAFLGTSGLRELLSQDQLCNLTGATEVSDFVDTPYNDDALNTYLKDELKVTELTTEILASKLTPNFMAAQTFEWVGKFYRFIQDHARSLYKKDGILRFAPIVKCEDGEWIAPYDQKRNELQVFFKLSSEQVLRGNSYKFVDAEYADKYHDFLDKELGIKQPDLLDFVRKDILSQYRDKSNLNIDDEVLRNEFDVLYDVLVNCKDNSIKHRIVETLYEEYYIVYDAESFCRCNELYDDVEELRSFYDGVKEVRFVNYDFYMSTKRHFSHDEVHSFMKTIGIKQEIIIQEKQIDFSDEWRAYNKLSSKYYSVYHKFDTSKFPQITSYQTSIALKEACPISMSDHQIDYLDHVTWTEKKSHNFWQRCIDIKLWRVAKLEFTYKVYKGKSKYMQEFESSIIHDIKAIPWIYNSEGVSCRPSQITIEEFHKLGYSTNKEIEGLLDFRTEAIVIEERNNAEQQVKDALFAALCGSDIDIAKAIIERHQNNNEQQPIAISGDNTQTEQSKSKYDDLEDETKSKARKTIHYIGVTLYESLLRDKLHIPYTRNDSNDLYDFLIDGRYTIISAVGNRTSEDAPIYLTMAQHQFMVDNHLSKLYVIRISLKSLNIDFASRIREFFGSNIDIDNSETLTAACDNLVMEYWKYNSAYTF